jgi:hypothetical protein
MDQLSAETPPAGGGWWQPAIVARRLSDCPVVIKLVCLSKHTYLIVWLGGLNCNSKKLELGLVDSDKHTKTMAPPRKRQKVSSASQSTATTLSRNVSAASTQSTPPHTPPGQQHPPQNNTTTIFTPNHVRHLISNLNIERTPFNHRNLIYENSQGQNDQITKSL